MKKPDIAWSHSALETFEQCPHKFHQTRVAKTIKEPPSPHLDWGKKVHAAFDRRLRMGMDFPSNMPYESMAKLVESMAEKMDGEIHTELQLAINMAMEPCDWKAWDEAFCRAALDILILNQDQTQAVALDVKTGKYKSPDMPGNDMQLSLQAGMVFRNYPTVETVKASYLWTCHADDEARPGFPEPLTFRRERERMIWKQHLPRAQALTDAKRSDEWPKKSSPLCGWCPVHTCEHWIKRG